MFLSKNRLFWHRILWKGRLWYCDRMPKCSNVECFCSQNNLCEEPSESEEYQQEICDKAQAGSKGKATIIVAFFIFILGGESWVDISNNRAFIYYILFEIFFLINTTNCHVLTFTKTFAFLLGPNHIFILVYPHNC